MNKPATDRIFEYFMVKRTFAIVCVMLMSLTGIFAYNTMIKESFPDLEIPQALVTTTWPGAGAELVEKEITNRIETALHGTKGLKSIRSGSTAQMSVVALEFHTDIKVDDALRTVERRISDIKPDLPQTSRAPRIERISMKDVPIATFAIFGTKNAAVLDRHMKTLERRLKKIPGIRSITAFGTQQQIVKISLDPNKLKLLGLSPSAVKNKIQSHNTDVPWGVFSNRELSFEMTMQGAARTTQTLAEIPVLPPSRDKAAVLLKDIATVELTKTKPQSTTFFSSSQSPLAPGVGILVYKVPGKDTVRLVEQVKDEINRICSAPNWPKGVKCVPFSDESELINDQLNLGFSNGWQAMVVVFAILFFLLSWKEALIAATCIPLTLLATTAFLYAIGYTFNILVIVGMILALGLLVDDFILVMEGMHEHFILKNKSFAQAAKDTFKTYAVPSLSGSLTTILVFVPLAFIGGVDGKFIRVIPVTAGSCLVFSYLISIIMSIPLSGLLFKQQTGKPAQKPSFIDRLSHKVEQSLCLWLLKKTLRSKKRALAISAAAIACFALSVLAASYLPNTMYPKEDGRNLGITLEFPSGTTLEQTQQTALKIAEHLRQKDYFQTIMLINGAKDPMLTESISEMLNETTAPYYAGISCVFTPRGQRPKLGFEYVDEIRSQISGLLKNESAVNFTVTAEIGGSSSEPPIQLDINGQDISTLRSISARMKQVLKNIPGTMGVRDNLEQTKTTMSIIPDREMLDFYGINEMDMAEQIRILTTFDKIGNFRIIERQDDIEIMLGTKWEGETSPLSPDGLKRFADFDTLSVCSPEGNLIPLDVISKTKQKQNPLSIPHKNATRCLTIKSDTDNMPSSVIMKKLAREIENISPSLPPGYSLELAGEKTTQEQTYGSMLKAFAVAITIVFAILALQFDSFMQPVIILCAVLFGLTGVFAGFYLFSIPMSFTALIGIVSLVGINVNDAIVMIDTMNKHSKNALPITVCAAKGACDRLRPIISTTLTTTAGLLPLAIAEVGWRPLCLAIIFGEMVSTLAAVFVIPCLFSIFTRSKKPLNELQCCS